MDDTDCQLIALLHDNAWMSVVALANKLRVARATVQNRIARMENDGTIVGDAVRLKPEAEAHRIRAIMSIENVLRGKPEIRSRPAKGKCCLVQARSASFLGR